MSETWLQIKNEIKAECNVEDADFVQDAPLMAEANRIIDEIKLKVIGMREENFKSKAWLTINAGLNAVTLPSNLFHAKIQCIWFLDPLVPVEGYEVFRVKNDREKYYLNQNTIAKHKYDIFTTATGGKTMEIYPVARVTSSVLMEITYIRALVHIAADGDTVDLGELNPYLKEGLQEYIYKKEEDWAHMGEHKGKKQEIWNDFAVATSPRSDDGNNELDGDYSSYYNHN